MATLSHNGGFYNIQESSGEAPVELQQLPSLDHTLHAHNDPQVLVTAPVTPVLFTLGIAA